MTAKKNLGNSTTDEIVDDIDAKAAHARRALQEDPGFIHDEGDPNQESYADSGSIRPDLDDQTAIPG